MVLEPSVIVEVTAPAQQIGDVAGVLAGRREEGPARADHHAGGADGRSSRRGSVDRVLVSHRRSVRE
jgi:hypothetical protein